VNIRRLLLVTPTFVTVGFLFIAPLTVLFLYSLGHSTIYSLGFGHTLSNYGHVFGTPYLRALIWRSMWMGTVTGVACVALAYPLAYAVTLGPLRRYQTQVLFLVLLSLFAAYIVRIYAWRTLLGRDGIINHVLVGLGLTSKPLTVLLYSRTAVVLTLINVTLPLAIIPLYAALSGVDGELVAAARSLGATSATAFRRVTLPLSARGVRVAFALCCIGAAGDYVTPQLVGDPQSQLAGNAIAGQFGIDFDWATGGAMSFTLVAAIALCVFAVFVILRVAGVRERP
jgi:spermidine/putrescine transport system permease protein